MLQGRDEPLAALRDGLTRARAGSGRLILISGEAGIGKSALADALAREAAEAGITVVLGEVAAGPPEATIFHVAKSEPWG